MGWTIDGDPGAIRSRAALLREKGSSFQTVADALTKVTTDGWTGRAADRFRDKFDAEPGRWRDAGDGFVRAAGALEAYAAALETAKAAAAAAKAEYERGERVTDDARSAYDADIAATQARAASARAAGTYLQVTILPFADPGAAVRSAAIDQLNQARGALKNAAHECAAGVRAGCAGAPEKRNWLESGLAFVGGVFAGAGEALWDLGEMAWSLSPQGMLISDLTSGMTAEELAAKHRMQGETALAMLQAMKDDPAGFGKNLGKALLDWDTWADDPARAIGHLVPDAVAAVLTGGTAAAATRGASGLGALVRHSDDLVDGLGDAERALDSLDDLSATSRVNLDELPSWTDGAEVPVQGPGADIYPDDLDRFGGLSRQDFYDRYWDPTKDDWHYPDEAAGFPDGFDGPSRPNTLDIGDSIDRLGPESGAYAAPVGTSYPERALPPSSIGREYHVYEVLKPLPDSVSEGKIAKWFEQPGGGIQYKFDRPVSWYVDNGYLKEVRP